MQHFVHQELAQSSGFDVDGIASEEGMAVFADLIADA
jgi:hypothetical protein